MLAAMNLACMPVLRMTTPSNPHDAVVDSHGSCHLHPFVSDDKPRVNVRMNLVQRVVLSDVSRFPMMLFLDSHAYFGFDRPWVYVLRRAVPCDSSKRFHTMLC